MDHKWGRNILKYGVGSTGATLAARFPGWPNDIVLTNARVAGTYALILYVPTNTSVPYYLGLQLIPTAFPHFPYGRSVEPDAPA